MKGPQNVRLISVISVFIAISGLLSLLIDQILKPFLNSQPEVKLIIILVSVISAYHAFLTFTLRTIIKEENENITSRISNVEMNVGLLKDSIPFSYLDDIERHHGSDNKNIKCEIWIIASTLQEAKNDETLLRTIYDNITLNRVHYYYILPQNNISNMEINALKSRLREMHKNYKRKMTGGISYRFDANIANLIPSEYFDIIFFIDCDDQGNPYIIGNTASCEGYQCYSKVSKDNNYFYQPINRERIVGIRDNHKLTNFELLKIEGE